MLDYSCLIYYGKTHSTILIGMALFNSLDQNLQPRLELLNLSLLEFALVVNNEEEFGVLAKTLNLATCHDFLHGLAYVIATHYVFSVTYRQYLYCTMQFIHKYFLEISYSSITKQKIITLMARLRKCASGLYLIWCSSGLK